MKEIFREGETLPLIGNEAVALGALESGVGFASTYPGTPASEIGNLLYKIKKNYGFYMEYSTNEIVALEGGAGAAFSGIDSLVAMKHFGVNVAMDALIPIAYTKPRGGFVLVVADDPGCHSSAQSEQDSRVFIKNLFLPTLEPSTPQEAKDFTKLAFEVSKRFNKLVIIRMTTRVSHQTAPVLVGEIKKSPKKGKFIKDLKRFDTMPDFVFSQKEELLNLKKEFENYFEKRGLNKIFNKNSSEKYGIICSGIGCLYVFEALRKFSLKLPVLKIDTFYPLPSKKINQFIKNKEKILVVEEGLGLIEEEIKIFAKEINPKLGIFGKNIIKPVNELNPERVFEGFSKVFKVNYKKPKEEKIKLVKRTPRFCPGCPYWAIFGTLQRAVDKKKVVFTGDIGCYMMGYFPPFQMQDTLLCMGSSLGLAHGISKATNQKVIAMIGDSTFFHAGLPGIINIVNNFSDPLIIVFDNQITAMTGRQPHPGTPLEYKKEDGKAEIKIEKLLKTIGLKKLTVLDPIKDNQLLEKKIKEYLKLKEPSAIVCKHPCLYVDNLEKMEVRY